jgi:hypothetical protein
MSKDEDTIYLLLARDCIGTWVCHYLLVVYICGSVEARGTVISLFVPGDQLDVFRHLKP